MNPTFTHDCNACRFLGTIHAPVMNHDTIPVDLYACKGLLGVSVIGRFSNDGPDYTSSPMKYVDAGFAKVHPELVIAKHMVELYRLEKFDKKLVAHAVG